MKVILIKDVKDLGRAHETVSVADGHALNYLIPGKFAISATPAALKESELRMKQSAERKEIDAKMLEQNLKSLVDAKIIIKAKANEKGHLYNAIGKSEIATAVQEQNHTTVPEEYISLDKPFKEIGTHEVNVVHGDVSGVFSITIEAE